MNLGWHMMLVFWMMSCGWIALDPPTGLFTRVLAGVVVLGAYAAIKVGLHDEGAPIV